VMCVGQNYADHCAEQGVPQPESPVIFSKFPQAIIGPGEAVIHPAITSRLDYEVELAIVIGQGGKNITEADAMHHVFGYTIANDITARDLQKRDGQWIRAKGCDTFCPLGPCIVTADAIADPHNLALRTYVNGTLRQNSNTDQLIFRIPKLIAWVSAAFALHPGDILLTGTPPGVGAYSKPPSFLQPGDKMRLEIDGIGALENTVASPPAA
jgi:2-keto-4-pentenoate hydratase/2-oxohepta-3-ene-1,7-dioic acid hydratase in catechol pathway